MRQLLRLRDPALFTSSDGIQAMRLVAEFNDGTELEFVLPVAELGNVISFFVRLTEFLNDNDVPMSPGADLVGPLSIHRIGFQAGQSPKETLLVAFLSACNLAFSLPSNELAGMAVDLSRIARTLSAEAGKPQ